MLAWIILCPLGRILFSTSSTCSERVAVTAPISKIKIARFYFNVENKHFQLSDINDIEDEIDVDFFSILHKFTLTPQYFFAVVYIGLIFQFFSFFKRKLPFCGYLAMSSQDCCLSKRVLLI